MTFLTPLSQVISRANQKHPIDMRRLSLSDSTDICRYGVDSEHLTTLADDLCLYLLLAGLKLAYGGRIGHDGEQVDDVNFTTRLFGRARSYSPSFKELGGRLTPIMNYVGWPIYLRHGDQNVFMFAIEFIGEAANNLRDLRSYDRKRILDTVDRILATVPTQQTRNQKFLIGLKPPWQHEEPIWELRIGLFRVFYDVDESAKRVVIRAVRRKDPHKTIEEIL